MVSERERRMAVLGPHVFDGVPLARAAADAGVPRRTAARWLLSYTADGSTARSGRSDRTRRRRIPAELVNLIEGMALRRPPPKLPRCTGKLSEWQKRRGGRRRRTRSSTGSSARWNEVCLVGAQRRRRLPQRLRLGATARVDQCQRSVAGRPHAARRRGVGRVRPAGAAVVDRHPGRQIPCRRRVHRLSGRPHLPADSACSAAGDLAEIRPGLAGVRTAFGCELPNYLALIGCRRRVARRPAAWRTGTAQRSLCNHSAPG